jgi:hypothetical protein
MTTKHLDPARCPLCGEPNDCGMVEGKRPCWCFATSIPREVLEEIPFEAKGIACVCRRCGARER